MTTATRRYSMTKLATGDWLLPSDDLRTLWRIVREPDGWWSVQRLDADYNTDGYQLVARNDDGTIEGILPPTSIEWSYAVWAEHAFGFDTRNDAIADIPGVGGDQ